MDRRVSGAGNRTPIRRVAITNVFGSKNRGDALLVEALVSSIQEAYGSGVEITGVAQFPETEKSVLDSVTWLPTPGRSYHPGRIRKKLETALRVTSALLYSLAAAPRWWPGWLLPKEQQRSIQAIRDADVAISCAGGFLIGNGLSLVGNILQLYVCHIFRTPLIIAPQTIGPINSKILAPLAHYALRRADLVCAREGFTYDYLVGPAAVSPSSIVRTTDVAFEHAEVDDRAGREILTELGLAPDEKFVAATVVDWYFPFAENSAAVQSSYRKRIVETLQLIHARTGLRVLLLNQVGTDLPLGREVAAAAGGWVILDEADRTPAEMRGVIQQATALLGSRFHSCVFALLSGVPTLALAYSYKSTGIMYDLGLHDRVTDIAEFEPEAVADLICDLVENHDREAARVRAAVTGRPFPRFSTVLMERANAPPS